MAQKQIVPKLSFISDYLKLAKLEHFLIPEYQRAYSWTTERCSELWQNIESFIAEINDAEESIEVTPDPYFFGTIIIDCENLDTENSLSLIDGQQRTTTFLLLLKALLVKINEVLPNINDSDSESLKDGLIGKRNNILEILYKADDESRSEILKDFSKVKGTKLLINKSINEKFRKEVATILEGETFSDIENQVYNINKQESRRKQGDNKFTNYFRNFNFFYSERLQNFNPSQINQFAKIFLKKCQVIEIRSWQTNQAITMFNSLNSKGMPLTTADIIAAKLYANNPSDNDKENFGTQWEELVKKTNELGNKNIVNLDAVLQQFMYTHRALEGEFKTSMIGLKEYYEDSKNNLLSNPQALCEKLTKIAECWENIADYPIVKLLLRFNENAKLYLASYLYRFDNKNITQDIVVEISEYLLKLFAILELVDKGYSSSEFKTFLFKENIRLVDGSIPITEIKSDFDNHIAAKWGNIESEIADNIKEYDKNLLVYLNDYLYAKENGQPIDFDKVTIEHIMAQSGKDKATIRQAAGMSENEFDEYVNKIGNKILLEEKINKSIGNEWFETKITTNANILGYKDSKYAIAQSLTSYPKTQWEKSDIETATQKAADRICNFIFGRK